MSSACNFIHENETFDVCMIKTHGSESRGQGGSSAPTDSRLTRVSIIQEQEL